MKLSLQSALAVGTLLAGIVLAYADLKYGVAGLRKDVEDLKALRISDRRRVERIEVSRSHLQSRKDEARVKR